MSVDKTSRRVVITTLGATGAALLGAGCLGEKPAARDYDADPTTIAFPDQVEWNEEPAPVEIRKAPLKTVDGQPTTPEETAPGKPIVLVMTRGINNRGNICVFCQAQTSRLISAHSQIMERGAEAIVVFPLADEKRRPMAGGFGKSALRITPDAPASVPFPLLVDESLSLVDALGVRDENKTPPSYFAKPATFIVDAEGNVRFAYVGKHMGDRPSVQAILNKLDQMKPTGAVATDPAKSPESEAASQSE